MAPNAIFLVILRSFQVTRTYSSKLFDIECPNLTQRKKSCWVGGGVGGVGGGAVCWGRVKMREGNRGNEKKNVILVANVDVDRGYWGSFVSAVCGG